MVPSLVLALGVVASTALVGYLVLLQPLHGRERYRLLERRIAADPRQRASAYRRGMVRQWMLAAAALALLAVTGVRPAQIGVTARLHDVGPLLPGLAFTVVGGALVALVLRRMPERAERLLRPVAALLPRTAQERRLFVLVALTAGVAEEVLYRGFLLDYLVHRPGRLSLGVALVVAATAFGLAHAYQGLVGVVLTGAAGLALASLYVVTGSLLLPVVVHALVDLRILLVVPRPSEPAPG